MRYTIDLQTIADELDFDLEDVEMLMEAFLESVDQNIQILKTAIETHDLQAIYLASHDIKGAAGNLLLNDIANIAKEIEINAKKHNTVDYNEMYEKLILLLSDISV